MKTTNVSSLKALLSAYLQSLREGTKCLYANRNKPAARIVPCQPRDHADQKRRLVSRGVLISPLKKRSRGNWPEPPGNVSDEVMGQVWREERESR